MTDTHQTLSDISLADLFALHKDCPPHGCTVKWAPTDRQPHITILGPDDRSLLVWRHGDRTLASKSTDGHGVDVHTTGDIDTLMTWVADGIER